MKMRILAVTGCVAALGLMAACSAPSGGVSSPDSTLSVEGKTPNQSPMLNLSHIVCNEDGTVDVHFVLLFWGNSTPPDLTATTNQGTFTTSTNKNSGNVWHYDITLASGEVDVTGATVGSVSLHNPDAYADTYTCGEQPPSCPVQPNFTGTQCIAPSSIGGNSPSSVCTWLGLTLDTDVTTQNGNLIGRDDGPFSSDTTTSLATAYVVVVKGGSGGSSQLICDRGTSVYNVYENVTLGQSISTGNGTTVSDVTYCRCPTQ